MRRSGSGGHRAARAERLAFTLAGERVTIAASPMVKEAWKIWFLNFESGEG